MVEHPINKKIFNISLFELLEAILQLLSFYMHTKLIRSESSYNTFRINMCDHIKQKVNFNGD
ncbi:MAG: hypothetical protein P8Y97_02975 [Candidatus Lokiarchaeota archaeon]